MIVFTRFNHNLVALNPDLIERVEATPDTVITMVDEKRVLVLEPFDEVVQLITDYRAYVIRRSQELVVTDGPRPALHLVPDELMTSDPETLARIAEGDGVETMETGSDGVARLNPRSTNPHAKTPQSKIR